MKHSIPKMARLMLFVLFAISLTLAGCGSAANGPTGSGNGTTTLTLYSSGDVNVKSLWMDTLIPGFKKAHPEIEIKLVFSEHGANDDTTIARLAAASAAGKDSGIDLIEGGIKQAITAKLMHPLTTSDVPLISHIDDTLMQQVNSMAIPYRASSVVLAYNSQYVQNPPKTLNDLLAWIKANPGKFTYNTPDSGGSGDAFVQAVLRMGVSADKQQAFTSGTNYDPALESQWKTGLDTLKSLKPAIYNNGFYPNGNKAVLTLLANSSIWIAPAWSDQALTALGNHQLPDSIKLIQLDPPFNGGSSFLGITKTCQHFKEAALFLNWVLDANQQGQIINIMHGYPGVQWSYVPDDIRQRYASIASSYATGFASNYSADKDKLWQSQVAGG